MKEAAKNAYQSTGELYSNAKESSTLALKHGADAFGKYANIAHEKGSLAAQQSKEFLGNAATTALEKGSAGLIYGKRALGDATTVALEKGSLAAQKSKEFLGNAATGSYKLGSTAAKLGADAAALALKKGSIGLSHGARALGNAVNEGADYIGNTAYTLGSKAHGPLTSAIHKTQDFTTDAMKSAYDSTATAAEKLSRKYDDANKRLSMFIKKKTRKNKYLLSGLRPSSSTSQNVLFNNTTPAFNAPVIPKFQYSNTTLNEPFTQIRDRNSGITDKEFQQQMANWGNTTHY